MFLVSLSAARLFPCISSKCGVALCGFGSGTIHQLLVTFRENSFGHNCNAEASGSQRAQLGEKRGDERLGRYKSAYRSVTTDRDRFH